MDWEAVAAIAQTAGLGAVVASLIYLGIQTRQSNAHAMASAETAWFDSMNEIIKGWVADERTTSAIRRGFRNFESLSKSDQSVFQMQVGALVNHWLLAEQLSAKGLFPKEISAEIKQVVVAVLATPGGFAYWKHDSKATPGGEELLRLVADSIGKQPTFTDLFPWWDADESE